MKSKLSVKICSWVNPRGGAEKKLKHRSIAKVQVVRLERSSQFDSDRLNVAQNTFKSLGDGEKCVWVLSCVHVRTCAI